MHLIKILVRRTLRSLQSVFYARSNTPKKKRFLASFLMGTFWNGLCFPRFYMVLSLLSQKFAGSNLKI